jgi:hypothetical protein
VGRSDRARRSRFVASSCSGTAWERFFAHCAPAVFCDECASREQNTAVSDEDLCVVDGDGKMTMLVKRPGKARADPTSFRLLGIGPVNSTPKSCVGKLQQHRVESASSRIWIKSCVCVWSAGRFSAHDVRIQRCTYSLHSCLSPTSLRLK